MQHVRLRSPWFMQRPPFPSPGITFVALIYFSPFLRSAKSSHVSVHESCAPLYTAWTIVSKQIRALDARVRRTFPTHLLGPRVRARPIPPQIRTFCAHMRATGILCPLLEEFAGGTSVSCGNIERRSGSGESQLLDKTQWDTGWSMINGTS